MCSNALTHTDFDTRAPCVWREDVASMSRTKYRECRQKDGLKRKRDDGRAPEEEDEERVGGTGKKLLKT